jgi:hypothetical protein
MCLGVVFVALVTGGHAVAAQPATTATRRPSVVSAGTATMDHARFTAVLRQYVVRGFVDYDGFARSPDFARYLDELDRTRPETLTEDDQVAYWINVYNAYTIQLIVQHQETASIRNIARTLGLLRLKGPWSVPLVRAGGRRLSLDEVQHTVLGEQFEEPRVHFALSCGAMGCPPLRSDAYTGAALLEQLEDQARHFLRDNPAQNRVEARSIWLSPVLLRARRDFGVTRADFLQAIAPYVPEADQKRLLELRGPLRESTFDWTLNSQAQAKRLRRW